MSMVDLKSTVCCMCGDIGFPDKLFRCIKCHDRFQHSYCSNYYRESSEPIELCDWCQSEERTTFIIHNRSGSSKKSVAANDQTSISTITKRSEYSGDKMIIKQHDLGSSEKGKRPTGVPSPRPTTRRYKLLKDVMC